MIKKIKEFLSWIGLAVLIFLGIKGVSHVKKNDDSVSILNDVSDTATSEGISRFRDRTGEALRGLFSDRGINPDSGNSGTGDTDSSAGSDERVHHSIGERTKENPSVQNSSNSSIGSSRVPNPKPINFLTEELTSKIEGAMIYRRGSHFLCLLAIPQIMWGEISIEELFAIYRQAIKDPSIMDRECKIGPKGFLLTYHAKEIIGCENYVINASILDHDFVIHEYVNNRHNLYDKTYMEIYDPYVGSELPIGLRHKYYYKII